MRTMILAAMVVAMLPGVASAQKTHLSKTQKEKEVRYKAALRAQNQKRAAALAAALAEQQKRDEDRAQFLQKEQELMAKQEAARADRAIRQRQADALASMANTQQAQAWMGMPRPAVEPGQPIGLGEKMQPSGTGQTPPPQRPAIERDKARLRKQDRGSQPVQSVGVAEVVSPSGTGQTGHR